MSDVLICGNRRLVKSLGVFLSKIGKTAIVEYHGIETTVLKACGVNGETELTISQDGELKIVHRPDAGGGHEFQAKLAYSVHVSARKPASASYVDGLGGRGIYIRGYFRTVEFTLSRDDVKISLY